MQDVFSDPGGQDGSNGTPDLALACRSVIPQGGSLFKYIIRCLFDEKIEKINIQIALDYLFQIEEVYEKKCFVEKSE